MKKVLFIVCLSIISLSISVKAQESPLIDDAADSIYLKCLYETRSYVSINLLQYVVGTANINYELFLSKQYSIKVGGGTILGYRILMDDYENCLPGGYYYMIEPRWYTYKSTKNCWMQIGLSATYKYWNYTRNEIVDDPNATVNDPITYKKISNEQYLGAFSVVGKHPVTGGFTFEYQAGVGAGPKNGTLYVTPNVGFSIGWIF